MIELLEQQKKLTSNQWKLICTANVADLLDFFDFFLIGYVTAALTKEWSLAYWQGGAILLASGLGAVPGAFIWGWLGDRIGRRTVFMWSAVTISLATGIMVFTPGPSAVIPGWLFLMFFRVFVGVGNAGIFTIDLPLVQEFIPAYKRGWVSALVTTLLPGGGMLAGLVASWLLPIVGWRYLFLVGLSPLVLVFMIRYWVPESPRWLIRMGRLEEARRSLAWALMIDAKEITLPAALSAVERTRWLELFKYPRLVAAGCLTGVTQTGGASLGLWGATLLVIVLNTTPAHAAFLTVFIGISAIAGRFFITALIEPLGRRGAGTLACVMAALLTVSAGYLHNVFIGGWSLFYVLLIAGGFFSSAIYSVVGPYMAEIWPARLRSSGMGMSYGIGNLSGKVLGPAGLAVIMGAGDIIKPAAPNLKMLGPAFVCVMAALLTVSAGYLHNVFIGGWSLFYVLLIAGGFFSSTIYSVVGPYMAEIWPARLRSSGMGMSYGIGNLSGKVLGPAGLAVIMGAGDIIKPAAPNLKMLGPAFVCVMAALLTVSAGYLHNVFIGGWSLFYVLLIAGGFFSSAIYSVVGPYMAEIWPARLRSSGMGMSYGIGNLSGKVLGPAGLAVIMGAGDIIKPAAPNLKMLGPAFVYFASWYILGIIGFWVFGPETKGRTFEEMDDAHAASRAPASASPVRAPAE